MKRSYYSYRVEFSSRLPQQEAHNPLELEFRAELIPSSGLYGYHTHMHKPTLVHTCIHVIKNKD